MIRIPFIDLKREYQFFKKDFKKLDSFLKKGKYILGKELELFEKTFAKFFSFKNNLYAIGVNSGTDALILALRALKVKEGDEIITTSFSFISTALAILHLRAKPVFVDIKEDYNISPKEIKKAISKKTKGIIIVHLFGLPCDMEEILDIKNKYGLFLIEDCAQSFGAKYKDSYCGLFGEISCFSFYPTKNLSCFGDGGMCLTKSFYFYNKIKELRNPNLDKAIVDDIGCNSRLDALQAKILRIKLKKIKFLLKKRRTFAKIYNKNLASLLICPKEEENKIHAYNIYTIRVEDNKKLKKYLEKLGIETKIYYPYPLFYHPIFKNNSRIISFSNAERFSKQVLSLPLYPFLKKKEIREIINGIKSYF
ncbi:MAG: DegT/DnrJ/EryC1/StrS family aminotransferase [candidate division WOR-3 bacterium]|nr:DegT/DnrJ/EryC1/StrS family aminotransferase [candidate division WOR-3 bacterium]MCX7836510.1 DegT/DnrJ/EryC1/StrS family aminotransferase [candidate division WOR-3 bacterium]MDW8113748.1 DegT/DnrJ/EryC1/StrS family aminotransferase [candidate division WOR-3 bacterium]